MKAYKGFNKDMTCRGFQYESGKTYEEPTAKLCDSGFHACIDPLDCFNYYVPGTSVYREVELEDNGEREERDTKICGKKIAIGAEINLPGIIKAHAEYVKSKCTMEHTDPKQATAGNCGAATAGNYGAATARGRVTVGADGVGTVRGNDVKIRGGMGAMLTIAVENDADFSIKEWKSFVIDGETHKADTWYTLKDGEIVEAPEE